MINLLEKHKNKLLQFNLISLVVIFFSCIFILLGSAIFELKIITLIGLITFLLFYFFFIINLLAIFIIKDKFNVQKKIKRSIYNLFLLIPISFALITIASVAITYITGFYYDKFYSFYFYFYFLPIIFIIWSFFISLSLYKKEMKTNNKKTSNIVITTFEHNECSICLKNSKI